MVSNQDQSHSASHPTLSTKEVKLPIFNDFPLPAAQEELCISLNLMTVGLDLLGLQSMRSEENEDLSLYPKYSASKSWTPVNVCLLVLYL